MHGASRGYIAVVYPGSDNNCLSQYSDDCAIYDPTAGFAAMFPNATFQLIARRAYLASRTLDWALSGALPVRSGLPTGGFQVSVTGHSRNGKQSMIVAAWDERVTAVVDSSSGVPAISTYRFSSGPSFSETPSSSWPGPWWLPSVRALAGNEDTVPIDSHALLGLIAPRAFLSALAWTDDCDPTFSVEKTYLAGLEVYDWLGADQYLRLQSRPGDHHGWEDPKTYFDWFDAAFSYSGWYDSIRPPPSLSLWPRDGGLFHNFSWAEWNGLQPVPHAMPAANATVEQRVLWGLGDAPQAMAAWSPGGNYAFYPYVDVLMQHNVIPGVQYQTVNFGEYVSGNLYWNANYNPTTDGALPAVLWLHPASYQKGFVEAYLHAPMYAVQLFALNSSAAVLGFDQASFGMRQAEGRDFYGRFPTWSLLGRMMEDVSAAIDLLAFNQSNYTAFRPAGEADALPQPLPLIDTNRIYIVGYDFGAIAGLYAAALDPRIKGVASIAGFEPLRNGTVTARSGGNQRLFDWHALQPRLGWFNGTEAEIPYDYDDILGLICPRDVLVVAPQQDRFHSFNATEELVTRAQHVCKSSLTFSSPNVVNELTNDLLGPVVEWLASVSAPGNTRPPSSA
jgi:hypothetical protein